MKLAFLYLAWKKDIVQYALIEDLCLLGIVFSGLLVENLSSCCNKTKEVNQDRPTRANPSEKNSKCKTKMHKSTVHWTTFLCKKNKTNI